MIWRVIPLETKSAAMNMATDGAIVGGIYMGKVDRPTIRFYKWSPSAVSLGYFQSAKEEVDIDKCEEDKIDVVRRRTGGGAVYHWDKGEITYSVICPLELMPKNIIESYKLIGEWIINALAEIGIKAEFVPINDIIVNGQKISGNAQTRRRGVFLQHGTILFDIDRDAMFSYLKVPEQKIIGHSIDQIKDRVTSIKLHKKVSEQEVVEALIKAFTKNKEWEYGELTDFEKLRMQELYDLRYSKDEWTFMK